MHGEREPEHRIQGRHMWSVATSSPLLTAPAVPSASLITVVSSDSFSKDGRKISVGDCALFKPPQDSPAFIGIIRRLISGEENNNLRLSVNWLYRPADVKLGKGASVEAAPNEVFYSFHKDEILAASLLHPCKIAFLRKGIELPSGISSFICRRVYDVENKCLWWLTDQDYINERQEEVDQLLQKTQLDMYGAAQTGGKSPKSLNGTTGNQQLRSNSEITKNINSHSPSQIKIKKRERVEPGPDSVKRERLSRADDTDGFSQLKSDQILKTEIAKITDSGGLVNHEGVEKFIQLMQPDSTDKKLDLACRMMLVDVIAVTEKFDCLGFFVQLKGLPVLDEWIQEIHKGKIGDNSSPKENDKSVDEFLLNLLRALDKLPVNLHALQTCNIGKSVNQLRAHKNIEIQKKARSLVDTWKKRVEAEMNVLDTKSGSSHGSSWPNKSMLPENSPKVVSGKISSSQSSKIPCAKFGSGEPVPKIVATSPNSIKLIASNTKDPISVTGSDPLSTIKEDKCSSSSHSHNNSQSCSSDHVKIAGNSCREDARSSTAGSVSGGKISVSNSRHRKSSHSIQGAAALPVAQKEMNFGKLSLNKNVGSEKVLPSGDVSVPDNGNNQRLIVRLPNTGRSPARSSTGNPYENSPLSAKNDHPDKKIKSKSDSLRFSPVLKDEIEDKNGLVRSDEDDNKKQNADERENKGAVLSSGYMSREGNLYDNSFKSMDALVESCVKFSEASATTTPSGGDDIGMNLLASVAAGEISRSDGSHSVSRGRNNLPVPEESCSGNDVNSRHIDEDTARSDAIMKENVENDNKALVDASVGISSEDAIKKENVENGGAGEFHDKKIENADMNANCINVKNNDSVLKLPEVSASTNAIMKEANGDSPSLVSTKLCQEEKNDVLFKVSESEILNEQKLPVAANTHQETEPKKITDTNTVNPLEQSEKQNVKNSSAVSEQSEEIIEKPDEKALNSCPDNKSSSEEPITVPLHQTDDSVKLNGDKERVVKLDFDLNEGFDVDDGFEDEIIKSPIRENNLPCPLPLPMSSVSGGFPASVTVASAAKGPFYPPENSFRGKMELGWKGSAATSAFRPAEPRKNMDISTGSGSQGRPLLDFDLNVADERDLEDEGHVGGLDLDLNREDESVKNTPKTSVFNNKPLLSGGFSNPELSSSRDFDLNSGPGPDDIPSELSATRVKTNTPYLSPFAGVRMSGPDQAIISGVRMSGPDQASLSSWFPQGNSYPPIAITPIIPNRGEQGYPIVSSSGSQRIMGHPAGIASFAPEFYRGQVLSSSPALPFPNNVPFQYPFPFDTNFSTPYSSIPSQLVGPSGSNYPRGAYMMNIPSGGGGGDRRWVGQGLDLNSGPGNGDERLLSSAMRHVPVPGGSQAFSAEEQMRMYQMASGSMKRKDPEGGWDGDRSNYKQLPPWQ